MTDINYFKNIKLLAYDFDGVMTNNKVFINQNGEEMVQVNRSDGMAISFMKKLNISQIIISSEDNIVVAKRAEKLKIPFIKGVRDKERVLEGYCKENNIELENVAFVGNDLNDLKVMKKSGLPICPSDAASRIKDISKIVLNEKGGDGVIRELFEYIQDSQISY